MDNQRGAGLRKAWYLGNTTVREAQRLRAGLTVLAVSPLNGNLEGRDRETAFARLLNDTGVLQIQRDINEDVSDLGRKWRVAMMQLGFIAPDSERLSENNIQDIRPYSVTENGQRLVDAQSLPAQQDCFLRALLAHQLPSPNEEFSVETAFSPLQIVLAVLVELERRNEDSSISKTEMAASVQLTTSMEDVPAAVEQIIRYRQQLQKAEHGSARKQIATRFLHNAQATQKDGTLADYADSNFRYLRLTGLFKQVGNRLGLGPNRRTLIQAILGRRFEPRDGADYLKNLWRGAEVPTDDRDIALAEIRETVAALEATGIKIALPENLEQQSLADIQRLLYDLEEQLLRSRESAYAAKQKDQWEDIATYLDALPAGKKPIPPREAPAYFEWTIWRAFLAINSLVNRPWESRNFDVYEGEEPYQSFLPVGCARGGVPDLLFEFEEFALVVEVTLTSSSRQEAAEGEPVRRHVADKVVEFAKNSTKPVYGLFLSVNLDTNTVETFRLPRWYQKDDSETALRIVPMTLEQFTRLFKSAFAHEGKMDYKHLEDLLRDCLAEINSPAPQWKRKINERVERFIQNRFPPEPDAGAQLCR